MGDARMQARSTLAGRVPAVAWALIGSLLVGMAGAPAHEGAHGAPGRRHHLAPADRRDRSVLRGSWAILLLLAAVAALEGFLLMAQELSI